jgi:hypothetical protein
MFLYLCNINGDVIWRKAKDEFTLRRNIYREYFKKFGRVRINEITLVKRILEK